MAKIKNLSLYTLLILCAWIVVFRATHIVKNEISWDIFGYYLPLEATFIEGDMMLNDRTWVEELNQKHQLSGTLYQISSTPDNQPMYFFLFGMSIMYSGFFFIGHVLAGWLGFPQDGLSEPYAYSLVFGCMIYTLIGLYYLRKILKHFFSDQLTALLLIICVVGTNYAHHMTIKNLETTNVLFMFLAIVLWNTIQWYQHFRLKNMMAIGVSVVLMALIKPSEVLIVFLPLLWGVTSFESLKKRGRFLLEYKNQLLITVVVCLVIALPQMMYWYAKTGSILYDSYKNPGVGLDIFWPHIIDALFSFRKGWLIYTPIMLFAVFGFVAMYKQRKELFIGLFVPFAISFYIMASWTEYWYGSSFSMRPVITQYPILLIAMGFFFVWVEKQQVVIRSSVLILTLFFIGLNQFQWWQLRNYILHDSRMTAAYYKRIFFKTSVTDEDKKLLLIERSLDGSHILKNPEDYNSRLFLKQQTSFQLKDGNEYIEFVHSTKIPYEQLTQKDHCWVRFTFDYRYVDTVARDYYFAVMMDRKNGDYGRVFFDMKNTNTNWQTFDTLFLTPEIRSVNDQLKFFVWNPNRVNFEAKNLQIHVLEHKN